MFSVRNRSFWVFAVLAASLFSLPLPAAAANRDPFGEGSMRLSLILGNGSAFDQTYFVAGAGFGYFIADGVELGLEAESWSGADPHITTLSPQVRYVLPGEGTTRPFAGVFYRRTLIERYSDLDSAGARAGLYFLYGRGGYFGAGIVYERYFSCNETVYRSCSSAYPELTFAIAF